MKAELISGQVEDYLVSRRVMGFELRGEAYQLRAFARFAQQRGHAGVATMDLVLQWARGARKPGPVTAARRIETLRPFLGYCRQFDPMGLVVPPGVCGPGHRRLTPHIYTEAEIASLLRAAQGLSPAGGLRPLTYLTLFGLLAATGMRISEALHLRRADLNLTQPAITIRDTKFKKSRMVPIHTSTARVLEEYQKATYGFQRCVGIETVFLTAAGQPLPKRSVHSTFDSIRRSLKWVARGGHPHPRIHDLRHTFICRALLHGQQDHRIEHVVDAISTYVGHAKVSDTYWYVSATPELMATASLRFSPFSSGGAQ